MCFKLFKSLIQTIFLLNFSSIFPRHSIVGATPLNPTADWITNHRLGVTPVSSDTTPVTLHSSHGYTANFVSLLPTATDSTTKEVIWDKVNTDVKQYQLLFCLYRCNGTEKIELNLGGCYGLRCFDCDCDKPRCEIYGTCCPDISESSWHEKTIVSALETSTPSDLQPRHHGEDGENTASKFYEAARYTLICEKSDKNMEDAYLFKRSCPRQFGDENIRKKCEEFTPISMQTTQLFTRVYDNVTEVAFFNAFCAACNGAKEENIIQWELSASCEHYGKVYKANDYDEFLRLVLDRSSTCEMLQNPRISGNYYNCYEPWFDAPVDRCNVTGLWKDYDEDVEKACTTYLGSNVAYRVRVYGMHMKYKVNHFKNIFCAICNMENYPTFSFLCSAFDVEDHSLEGSIFSFLINFGTQERPESPLLSAFQGCSQRDEWTSPDNRCMPFQCTPGKTLVNGTCKTAVDQMRQLAYQVNYLFMPVNFSYSGQEKADVNIFGFNSLLGFLGKFEGILGSKGYEWELVFSLMLNQSFFDQLASTETNQLYSENNTKRYENEVKNKTPIKLFAVVGAIVASDSLSRDAFEREVMDELFDHEMTIQLSEDTLIVVEPVPTLSKREDILRCDGINDTELRCFSEAVYRAAFPSLLAKWSEDDMPVLGQTLICPYISFKKSDYIIETNRATLPPNITITLTCFNASSFTFTEPKELKMLSISDDGTLFVCHEMLQAKMAEHLKYIENLGSENSTTLGRWQYILSLICASVSMLCIVLTLLTYSLFSQLRNVAGRNNMCLSGSLLLAQILLIITVHIRSRGFFCTALGITTHFMWLSVFCWCCACCFHMFRVFTAQSRSSRSSQSKSEMLLLLSRAGLCLGVPALIIIGVIIISYITSGGQRIGYGAFKCYLDSTLLLITTMTTPLILILLCNFVFFTITIVKIHNIRKLQVHTDFKRSDRDTFYIYIKLSSLTGAFWIVHVISEAINNDVLRFIALFLNGLQGLFIFLSFVCNKRVLRMYIHALRPDSDAPATISTSGQGTITELVSAVNQINESNRQGHREN